MLNRIIFGRYELKKHIGGGGMGEVFLATDLQLGEKVVIKIAKLIGKDIERDKERFLSEASLLSSLDHPGIVKVNDCGQDNDELFYVMEYVSGKSLGKLQNLKVQNALPIFCHIAEVISYLHSRGVIHYDIKPDNIIVLPEPEPISGLTIKIIDFGLARHSSQSWVALQDQVVGTINYMSPEQLMGGQVDCRSDLYSFGATMYHALTSRLPVKSDNPRNICYQMIHRMPDPPSIINKEVPPKLESLVLRLLCKDPEERIQTASEVHRLIKNIYPNKNQNVMFQLNIPHLTGRDYEYDLLTRIWQQTKSKSSSVIIMGPSGIGKTRLVDELAYNIQLSSGLLLRARGYHSREKLPFEGLKMMAFSLSHFEIIGTLKLPESVVEHLAILDTNLANKLHYYKKPFFYDKIMVINAWIKLISDLSKRQPIIIIIEDCDELDKDSIDACVLAQSLNENSILLIITYRENQIMAKSPSGSMLMKLESPTVIKLNPLDDTSSMALIRNILGKEDIPQQLLGDIKSHCHGNPFMITEFIRSVYLSNGLYLDGINLIYDQSKNKSFKTTNYITNILSLMSNEAKILFEFASVYNEQFSFKFANDILKLPYERIIELLDELVLMGVIKQYNYSGQTMYELCYPMIVEQIILTLSKEKLQNISYNIAQILEENANLSDQTIRTIALHYKLSGNPSKAVKWSFNYGLRLIQLSFDKYVEEIKFIEEMAELTGRNDWFILSDSLKAIILFNNGDFQKAINIFKTVTCNMKFSPTTSQFGKIISLYADCLIKLMLVDEAISVCEYGLKILTENDQVEERFNVLSTLALSLKSKIKLFESEVYAKDALELAQEHLPNKISCAQNTLLRCLIENHNILEARNLVTLALNDALEKNDMSAQLRLHLINGIICWCEGEFFKSVQEIKKSIHMARSSGDKSILAFGLGNLVRSYYCMGEFDKIYKVNSEMKMIGQNLSSMSSFIESEGYSILADLTKDGWQSVLSKAKMLENLLGQTIYLPAKIFSHIVMGIVYHTFSNFEKEYEIMNKAWQFANQTDSNICIIEVASWLLYSIPAPRKPNYMSDVIEKILSIKVDLPSKMSKLNYLFSMGLALSLKGEGKDLSMLDRSIAYLNEAKNMSLEMSYKPVIAKISFSLGKTYERRGIFLKRKNDIDTASQFYFETEFIYRTIGADFSVDLLKKHQSDLQLLAF